MAGDGMLETSGTRDAPADAATVASAQSAQVAGGVAPMAALAKAMHPMVAQSAATGPVVVIRTRSGHSAKPIVVVGSGLSGYTLIRQLRQYDAQRPIVLITADGGEVYSKPLLSNALAQEQTPDGMVRKSAEDKAAELNITLLLNRARATSIDPVARVIDTTCGDIRYHSLVLATGANQRVVLPDGAEPEWVNTVNSLDDYRRWYGKLGSSGKKVLLIGAGLIGCEFADDLTSRGMSVEMVDPMPWPLWRFLPERMGAALTDAFTQSGVSLHMGRYVAGLERNADGRFRVTLSGGTLLEVDLVLSAVGLLPSTELARSAGLRVAQGIRVDRQMRTSDRRIYAMGDCAETKAGVQPFLLPLMAQARVLAQVLSGRDAALSMGAMPVTVKTTSLPLVVCPPRYYDEKRGWWKFSGSGRDLAAVYHIGNSEPLGFVVSGEALKEKAAFTRQMPPLLAPSRRSAAGNHG